MGLQKKAIEAMRPVKTRVLSLIESQGEKLADCLSVVKLPSGLEVAKICDVLTLEASFEGLIGGVASTETLKVVFEDYNNANCLPTIRTEWRKGEGKPPVYLGYGIGYWGFGTTEGNNAVALKRYPVVAIEFLILMNDGRELAEAPILPELDA